jgi:hypothetical protein
MHRQSPKHNYACSKYAIPFIHSYKLWYRLACPQPEQPELAQSTATCTEGPLVLVTSTDQTQFTVTGSTVADPFPYSRYQFLVEARNSIGAVNSSFSSSVETETSGKIIIFLMKNAV